MLFTKSRKHLGIKPGVGGEEWKGKHTVKNISKNERWVTRQEKGKGKQSQFENRWQKLRFLLSFVPLQATVFSEFLGLPREFWGYWRSAKEQKALRIWLKVCIAFTSKRANYTLTEGSIKKASLVGNQENGWCLFRGMCEINLAI